MQVPVPVARPARLLELVLDVEHPDADRGGEQHDRQMHQQERLDADQPDQQGDDRARSPDWSPWCWPTAASRAHQADRQAMLQDEEIGRADAEHHQRMAVQAIAQPAPEGAGTVLVDGQRLDVADAAAVEIAGAGVVRGCGVAPHVVRREGQHAGRRGRPSRWPAGDGRRRRGRNRAGSRKAARGSRRRRSPAAGPANSRYRASAQASAQSAASGTIVMAISTRLRPVLGCR